VVTLLATPKPGLTFQGWTGDVEGIADTGASTISVVMTGDRSITANFAPPPGTPKYAVDVQLNDCSMGHVIVRTPCGSFATDNLQQTSVSIECLPDTELELSALASPGYRFRRWSGDLSGSHENVTLSVDSAKAITAVFADVAKASPFPWVWVAAGVVAVLLAALALLALLRRRTGRPTDTPPP
jgi:uncharacterized repeat protein (TIGR02543 family)